MTMKREMIAKKDTKTLSYIPNRGRGTLPVCDPRTHPNLVRVFLDAQYDYSNERLYLVGARIAAASDGEQAGARTLARFCEEPPDSAEAERELLTEFAQRVVASIAEKAMPDADGDSPCPAAPNLLEPLLDAFALGRA